MMRRNTSSRCQMSLGFRRRCRSFRANSEPDFLTSVLDALRGGGDARSARIIPRPQAQAEHVGQPARIANDPCREAVSQRDG
jgi:hypothetical protein